MVANPFLLKPLPAPNTRIPHHCRPGPNPSRGWFVAQNAPRVHGDSRKPRARGTDTGTTACISLSTLLYNTIPPLSPACPLFPRGKPLRVASREYFLAVKLCLDKGAPVRHASAEIGRGTAIARNCCERLLNAQLKQNNFVASLLFPSIGFCFRLYQSLPGNPTPIDLNIPWDRYVILTLPLATRLRLPHHPY